MLDDAAHELSGPMAMHDRLREARRLAGFKTASAAWEALTNAGVNVSKPYYIQNENGRRTNWLAYAQSYADFYGVSVDWLITGRGKPKPPAELPDNLNPTKGTVPANTNTNSQQSRLEEHPRIIGRVAAGVFRPVETIDKMNMRKFPVSPFPIDPRYPVEQQFDLIVEGDSINNFAQDGELLRCVRYPDSNVALHDGDLVIVRRIASGVAETTAKRYRRSASGQPELWFDSSDPALQGRVRLEGDDVSIIAVALYSYRPARPLAAGL